MICSQSGKRARGETPDVYTYDDIPNGLRVQIVHIIRDAFGKDRGEYDSQAAEAYTFVHDHLCREYGVFKLSEKRYPETHQDALFDFFLQEASSDRALDVVELCFKMIDRFIRDSSEYHRSTTRRIKPDDAIEELNARFKEHGIGYQYESGEIIRVDSEFLHAEAVKPALAVLRGEEFAGANEEFLNAHEHYRHGRHKESLVDALKAFESTMKAICHSRAAGRDDPTATAKGLIKVCFDNGLVPPYLESQMASLRSLLESGIPHCTEQTRRPWSGS